MALIDRFFTHAVKRGELTVTHSDGSVRRFGAPDTELKPVSIRLGKGAAGRIVRDPALGAAESFMEGGLIVEQGDILDLLYLITANHRWERGTAVLRPSPLRRLTEAAAYRIARHNMARRSKRNVAHHYDLSAQLYDLFLDADRQYSCAYYIDPANSLEQAQLDKKAHIAAKLAIRRGMKLLDIGCGWGGLALYLHEKTGAEVLGITLSEEQLKIARERAAAKGVSDKVRFELVDYRALGGTFDRIVSVGMFEHVGVPQYPTFFAKCRELMSDDGVMLLHTIGRLGGPGVTDAFTQKYIFPGGYIPSLSELAQGYEGSKLFPTDLEVLRLHYGYTLKAWYDRVQANREQIVALYDERFFRMWSFYLAGSYVSFINGGLVNYQLQLSRSRTALPITRDYMVDAEAQLRAEQPAERRTA